jgi:hypothetical protein
MIRDTRLRCGTVSSQLSFFNRVRPAMYNPKQWFPRRNAQSRPDWFSVKSMKSIYGVRPSFKDVPTIAPQLTRTEIRRGRMLCPACAAPMVLCELRREQIRLDAHGAMIDDVAAQVTGRGQQADCHQTHHQRTGRRHFTPAAPAHPGYPREQHD